LDLGQPPTNWSSKPNAFAAYRPFSGAHAVAKGLVEIRFSGSGRRAVAKRRSHSKEFSMDFELSEEHLLVQAMVKEFAAA